MGVSVVFAQDTPADIKITWVETSQFPQIQVYLAASSANSNRFAGLFVDALKFFEDGSQRSPSMYDAPRGTSVTFLIDADQYAEMQWDDIRKSIESYVSITENWMDEDYDKTSVIVATGANSDEWKLLVEDTSYRNDVFNAFITETGAYYTPNFKPITPLGDLIQYTLDNIPAETSTPGMYRALVLFSGGDMGGSMAAPEVAAAAAKEMGIPIFTVSVGPNPAGELTMNQLASNTGGQHYVLEGESPLIPLWQILSSQRQQYVISYQSQIVASGSHNVKVQITDKVQDSQNFDITILNPKVEITYPESNAIILRTPMESSENVADMEPKTQSIKYLWSWPDNYERDVQTVQLRVNGAIQQQLDLTTSDDRNLVWDISNLAEGPYSLRVEVVDVLGLIGQSLEIPVTIKYDVEQPTPEPTPTVTPTPRPPIMTTAYNAVRRNLPCIAGSGLGLSALLVAIFAFTRRLSYMGRSPIQFLRSLPFFRPIDRLLKPIERMVGPLKLSDRYKKAKEDKLGKPAAEAGVKTPEKPKMAPGIGWLEVVLGPTPAPGPFEIRESVTFGRSHESAKAVIPDRTVSRQHASIVPEHGSKYRIYNHSTQETWVNEQRVPEHGLLLNDGDEIRMGKVKLKFHIKKR